jgi:glycosyltransferase involved in cell wall biosynthesis
MVRVIYLTRINFFSNKAHVHTISKTCEALSLIPGISLKLVSTDNSLRVFKMNDDFFKLHNILKPFEIISLNSYSNLFKNSSNFFIYNLSTAFANISLIIFVWKNRRDVDCVYFRDHLILPVILFSKFFLSKKVIYESHYILSKSFGQWLTEISVKVSVGVVAIAIALKNYFQKFNKNIIVSFCASSDLERFKTDLPNLYFKNKLGLTDKFYYLVYTGNIDSTGNGDSYGVEDIVNALPLLAKDIKLVVVGKKIDGKHKLEFLADSLGVGDRFICVGWVSRDIVTDYVLASDLLLIPKSGGMPGNSPTKMFEYLGSGRPIVAADTLPMREVLRDRFNSVLVDYKDPKSWADAISNIREDDQFRMKIIDNALSDANLYTWDKRAETIGSLIKKNV